MSIAIPNRPVFRSQEVCELADVQPYVLRTWEAEFPDLGVAKAAGGPRVYRRADVERVLHIKHLLFVEGLTIAGVRRRLGEEPPVVAAAPTIVDADVAALVDVETRRELKNVRSGLEWILGLLAGQGSSTSDYGLAAESDRGGVATSARAVSAAKGSKGVGKATHGKVVKGTQKKGPRKR